MATRRSKRKCVAPKTFSCTPQALKTLKAEFAGLQAIQDEVQSSLNTIEQILQQTGMLECPPPAKKNKNQLVVDDLEDDDTWSAEVSEHDSDQDFLADEGEEEYEEEEEEEEEEYEFESKDD